MRFQSRNVSHLPSYEALRTRFDEHRGATFAGHPGRDDAALYAALEAIGWRAAGEDALALVASLGTTIIDACVYGHHDVSAAARDLADLMRHYAPRHSDFLAPLEDFIPAAQEVLHLYVVGVADSDIIPPPI
jgi:hypothetical protein